MYNISNLVENETITIPLIAGGQNEIAWGTLEFIAAPTQTVSLAGKRVTTLDGIADIVGETIVYTLKDATPTNVADILLFKVQDVLGNQSPVDAVVVTFNLVPAPVSDDLEVCSTCYTSTPFFDVGDYATGDYVPSLTEVVVQPTAGTLVQEGSSFSYIQDTSQNDAVDSFDYKLVNANGVESNVSTVYILRRCMGFPTNTVVDITCTSKTFNLQSLLSNAHYFNTGTWSEITTGATTYIGQSGTITGAHLGTVNFTSILPGEYKFRYTGTIDTAAAYSPNEFNCPQTATTDITIIQTATPAITYTTNSNLSGLNYQINFTVANVTNPSTITVTRNATPVTSFVVNPQLSFTTGFFVITLGAGTNTLVISALTTCGNTVTTNAVIEV